VCLANRSKGERRSISDNWADWSIVWIPCHRCLRVVVLVAERTVTLRLREAYQRRHSIDCTALEQTPADVRKETYSNIR
jgi:hypothetical protein